MKYLRIVFALIFLGIIPHAGSAQLVTWRGNNFSGVFEENNLLKEWPEQGPDLILEIDDIGKGWGSPILVGNLIYIIGNKDTNDVLSCFNLDGALQWEGIVGKTWSRSFKEARSSPTIEDDRVYASSSTGHLKCFDRLNGKLIWELNVDSLYQGRFHRWGMAQTPLIVDDLIISIPAGDQTTMVAHHKLDGKLVWKTKSIGNDRSYSTPVRFQYGDLDQIIGLTSNDIFAVDVTDGTIDWIYNYMKRVEEIKGSARGNILTNSPIIKDKQIYITSGYDNISVMLEVEEDGNSVNELWVDRTLDCHHHGVVNLGDYIYGSNWYNNRLGKWVSLHWETGEVMYVDEWNNKGVTVAADDMLYLFSEKPGELALVKPDKDGLNIVSSFEVDYGEGQFWAHPFIADGKLLIRHGEVMRVYDIQHKED